jgi:hypothetical protein
VGLSSEGELILIEFCLSLVVYLLHEEIHHKMDTARANFFWHGPNMKRKYHMAKWELMATPKKAGVGFTNTRVINKCHLAKKIFEIERGNNNLC